MFGFTSVVLYKFSNCGSGHELSGGSALRNPTLNRCLAARGALMPLLRRRWASRVSPMHAHAGVGWNGVSEGVMRYSQPCARGGVGCSAGFSPCFLSRQPRVRGGWLVQRGRLRPRGCRSGFGGEARQTKRRGSRQVLIAPVYCHRFGDPLLLLDCFIASRTSGATQTCG